MQTPRHEKRHIIDGLIVIGICIWAIWALNQSRSIRDLQDRQPRKVGDETNPHWGPQKAAIFSLPG